MKIVYIILLGFFLFDLSAMAKPVDEIGASIVQNFIDVVKTDNAAQIARYVQYPMHRSNPIPQVVNEQDFIKRYEMIFDDELKKNIIESKVEDWSKMGWRGIMLHNGLLWLDDEGKMIALNHTSIKEDEYAIEITKHEREKLYPALRQFYLNKYIFETEMGHGRIDDMADDLVDSEEIYRYTFWNKGRDISEKPDIIIDNGTVEYHGTANNTYYIFKNGAYTYQFEVTYVGHIDTPPYALVVLKDDKEIATYSATLLR